MFTKFSEMSTLNPDLNHSENPMNLMGGQWFTADNIVSYVWGAGARTCLNYCTSLFRLIGLQMMMMMIIRKKKKKEKRINSVSPFRLKGYRVPLSLLFQQSITFDTVQNKYCIDTSDVDIARIKWWIKWCMLGWDSTRSNAVTESDLRCLLNRILLGPAAILWLLYRYSWSDNADALECYTWSSQLCLSQFFTSQLWLSQFFTSQLDCKPCWHMWN